ncbi:hypothetical protein BD770DRAFT_393284 [Pilaira anomala]|nr:hypothetical protein BD770DRAFT_393284 [Pilaira anomala]
MSSFPEPMPSISTPIHPYADTSTEFNHQTNRRPRRHTIITRPDSALGLSSDMEDDEQEQQEAFDRISGILSSLIQEANEAVHGIEQERVQLLKSTTSTTTTTTKRNTNKVFTSSTIITNNNLTEQSKIPRPARRSRTLNTHRRGSSSSSSSSSSCTSHSTNTSSALLSPVSTSTSATLLSSSTRSPSPIFSTLKKSTTFRQSFRPIVVNNNTISTTSRRSHTPKNNKKHFHHHQLITDPITESFKRLDTSMAMVESLSRDLASPEPIQQQQQQQLTNNNYTFLLLVPLLHIPHSLITMIFDFITSPTPHHQNQLIKSTASFSFTSMIFWTCVFALTNLMVDQVSSKKPVSVTQKNTTIKTRRLSLPGTYDDPIRIKNTTATATITTTATATKATAPKATATATTATTAKKQQRSHKPKHTWIPSTIQQQYQFRIGKDVPLPPTRRNSI